ncbi:MFS general substrate transporter, partial [Macrolepiota fuliginosa MF-IS2]
MTHDKLQAPTMTSKSSVAHEARLILKIDNNGLPLIPQPTASPLDPLNYPNWLKYTILAEVSALGFISGLCGTLLNPAVGQLSQEFQISPTVASYQSAALIVAGALTAPIMIPLANAYGHRLVFLLSSMLTMVFLIAAAESKSFSMLFVLRTLTGISWTNPILGVAVISNLFFVHQRGKMMGFFTVV